MPRVFHNGRPTIGVLAGWQYYWTATPLSYLNPIYRGIRLAARDHGCNLLLGCGLGTSAAFSDPLRPAWPILSPEADFVPIGPWNTTGLIAVNPMFAETRSRDLQTIIAGGHPVVFVGSGEQGPTVVADNAGGIFAALEHLVEHGHRQIAFIAGSQEDMAGDTGARLSAYRSAVQAFGLTDDLRLVAYGRHISAGGYAAMREIMDAAAPFSAVLASNDESAFGAMQALKEAGLRIPEDVAIIGFDDRPESAVQEPALSSVHVSLFNMGYRAVDLLLRRIADQAGPVEVVKEATRLVRRESCGCGRNNPRPAQVDAAEQPSTGVPSPVRPADIAQAMAAAVLTETRSLSLDEVHALSQSLLAAFMASVEENDATNFLKTLDAVLHPDLAGSDDGYVWDVALSLLCDELPNLFAVSSQAVLCARGHGFLDQARDAITASMWRQHRRYVVAERWTVDRIGLLTANLLTALDETQVYQVLAEHLPEMGIQAAWVAEFVADGDDPVAWSHLRPINLPDAVASHWRSREFPPVELSTSGQPFSLALLPLVNPYGQVGFVAFDSAQLDLYGAIVQQLAGALNTARLYREATEGRRLAEEANQMKSRFLSTVSHELRTPLNLIMMLSGILLQESDESGAPLPEATRQDVDRIHASAQHLGGLIGDVLDLASSEAGQLRLTHEFVDLGQALHMVAEIGRQLAEDKGLAWHTRLPESGPWVWGDRTRLRQVVLNLISNAVKFTARGEVSLELTAGPDAATVRVRDSGLGIPPDEQQVIFGEFRRSERSITRGYGGMGLGLAICKRLVELHGGSLGVYSTGEEGAGSSFHFTLPTVPAPVNPAAPANPATAERRVMVLSGHDEGSQSLYAQLRQRGFRVQMAPLEESTTWQVQLLAKPPSAVVLDTSQVTAQSWSVLTAIKSNPMTQDIPVLLYAGAQAGGALLEVDYLTKPIELTVLTHVLDQHWLDAGAAKSTRTFLVVDDDGDTLEMHARIVQAHAASNRVLKARNGREALEIMERVPVDLVLLDLLMPEMDGFGVLEAMRARPATRAIPVIVVTGQVLTEVEMTRLNQGVAAVLGKGLYSLEETLAHLESALERKRKLSGEAQRLVRKAMAYLHEHYSEPTSRHDLARYIGMDEDYLTYCFRQELGMTPVAYLTRYRITQARHLLTTTDKSIATIALEVGFSDSGYFSRVFRREVGMAPDLFRRA